MPRSCSDQGIGHALRRQMPIARTRSEGHLAKIDRPRCAPGRPATIVTERELQSRARAPTILMSGLPNKFAA